jgi:uridine phosphorylase
VTFKPVDKRNPMSTASVPLLQHPLEAASAFTPERLMDAVRAERELKPEVVPPLCVLDFDGDLSDYLADEGLTEPMISWACFHTSMRVLTLNGLLCGIIPRTIGGPYTVLIAEQLSAAGARLIVGITSAGRVSPSLSLPSLVVIDEAVRDEGTSLHYLPPSSSVATPSPQLADLLAQELIALRVPMSRGAAWTTDAPYRETADQLRTWAERGVLAVEMQAASLFAFARARGVQVGMIALVSNDVDQLDAARFDTGGHEFRRQILVAVGRAAQAHLKREMRQRTRKSKSSNLSRRSGGSGVNG